MILALVAPLSQLLEKQKYVDEVFVEPLGLALARGAVTEFIGKPGAGKSSLVLSVLAQLTRNGEICAAVDGGNGFNPVAAQQSGVVLENLLWVKADHSLKKAFQAASFLAQAKGFGAIWLNLNSFDAAALRTVPTTYWYRFRNLVKDTPTILLVTAEEVAVGSATSRSFVISRQQSRWSGRGKFKLLREFHLHLTSRKLPGEPNRFNFSFCYEDN